MEYLIGNKLKTLKEELDELLRVYPLPDLPSNLYDPIKYTLRGNGKRLRPILVFIVGEGLGAEHKKLIPPALSIEIIHTFTLVHDDIIDNDSFRRGIPTVHSKWDVNTAILSGDALMCIAFKTLMGTDSPEVTRMGMDFSRTLIEICEGQALDIYFEKRNDVTSDEYLNMVSKKTGQLIGLSCRFGATVAGSSQKVIDELTLFGQEIGQAFQIQDDLLELISDEEKMGKSLGSDIASMKKTYPMVSALSGMNEVEKGEFLSTLLKNKGDREKILYEFQKMGCIDQARAKVNEILEKARERLKVVPLNLQKELNSFIDLISNRQS